MPKKMKRQRAHEHVPFGQIGHAGNGVEAIDISHLEKEYGEHERAGFKEYRKKVGITSTFTEIDFGEY